MTTMNTLEDHYDVVVIGAGIQGLCAAHTFLSIDPSLSLLLVDREASVGGTWSRRRVYPGLHTNNVQGYFEYSDLPLLDQNVGVEPRGLISGEAAANYLEIYAEKFGLLSRILFNTSVVRATNNDDDEVRSWTVELANIAGDKTIATDSSSRSLTCSKLLVATGQTSTPVHPSYPGRESFKNPAIHTMNFGSDSPAILENHYVKHVTVIGGGKSAYDAVYSLITNGKKQVTWIIRKSGRGGQWMAKPYPQIGPFRVWLEGLLMTRPLSWFGACPWSIGDGFGGIRYLLHSTAPGRWVTRNYFANMAQSTLEQSGVARYEKTKALIPEQSLQWIGGQAAILHHKLDFYDLMMTADVKIIHENIARAEDTALVLEDGQRIETDAIIYATGYKYGSSISLLPETNRAAWGVPIPPSSKGSDMYHPLEQRADTELFARFPELKNSPKYPDREPELSPWRLWRFIAPPSQVTSSRRNIVFLTNIETYQNFLKAELVSLWSYAYLHHELSIPTPATTEDVMYEATLWSRFGKWRCPLGSQGNRGDTLHDNMPYYDLLMRDLGLRSWRKGWGVLGEIFGGRYEVSDYKGVVQEWMASRESAVRSGKSKISL